DQIEAMTMADKIVVMQDGRVEQIGAPLELYDRPNNLFVAGFIGSPAMNMLTGKLDTADPTRFLTGDGTALPVSGSRPEALGRALIYGARPEAIMLGGTIPLEVIVIEPTGSESQVLGRIGKTQVTCVFRERVTAKPGETIPVSIDPKAVHLFDAGTGARLSA
ncbi:MAG: TOBE domain-containing protein, partial [Rhizobiaceae bacterium]|nr:TOBE domain-containing protein [Rhizobiaceae bacterium]